MKEYLELLAKEIAWHKDPVNKAQCEMPESEAEAFIKGLESAYDLAKQYAATVESEQ